MPRGEALALLAEAPVVHLATTTPAGAPVIRTLHPVVLDGDVYFHAAAVGEKADALGRAAVLAAEELVASIPSYFVDAERACPATTLYRSVQLRGTLEVVDDAAEKARVLAGLMQKYQPEAGHAPLDPAHARYRALYDKQVASLLILRVRSADLDGKAKLLQNRSPDERVRMLERMWQRGARRRSARHRARSRRQPRHADAGVPPFAPKLDDSNGGSKARTMVPATLHCALDPRDVDAAVALLAPEYWNDLHPPAAHRRRRRRLVAVRGRTRRRQARRLRARHQRRTQVRLDLRRRGRRRRGAAVASARR